MVILFACHLVTLQPCTLATLLAISFWSIHLSCNPLCHQVDNLERRCLQASSQGGHHAHVPIRQPLPSRLAHYKFAAEHSRDDGRPVHSAGEARSTSPSGRPASQPQAGGHADWQNHFGDRPRVSHVAYNGDEALDFQPASRITSAYQHRPAAIQAGGGAHPIRLSELAHRRDGDSHTPADLPAGLYRLHAEADFPKDSSALAALTAICLTLRKTAIPHMPNNRPAGTVSNPSRESGT